jgi:antitoxin (DNA-binding transcriptional repressor) of toxin-antitoxin stability system
MLHVKIAQLQEQLASLLRKVQAGESVTVYDGETPIARIEPPATAAPTSIKNDKERLASLIARGIVEGPKKTNTDLSFLEGPLPKAKASVLEALLEERREGR